MNNRDHKQFVIIGDETISPEELMECYGLTIDECHLREQRYLEVPLLLGRVTILTNRPNGDYKEHLQEQLQDEWNNHNDNGQEIKKAKKKTKFYTDVPWANELKKRGKM